MRFDPKTQEKSNTAKNQKYKVGQARNVKKFVFFKKLPVGRRDSETRQLRCFEFATVRQIYVNPGKWIETCWVNSN